MIDGRLSLVAGGTPTVVARRETRVSSSTMEALCIHQVSIEGSIG